MNSNLIVDIDGQRWVKDTFMYNVFSINMPINTGDTQYLNIESDSQFVWEKTGLFVIGNAQYPAGVFPDLDLTVEFSDTGSGRQLQTVPVRVLMLAGILGLPFNLPEPKRFKENSTIAVSFRNNIEPAGPYSVAHRVGLSLHGYKLFRA